MGYIIQFPRGRCGLMRAPLVAHVPLWPAQGCLGQQEFQIGSKNFGPQHARSMPSTPSTPPVEWYIFATMSRRVINCAKLCLSHPFDLIKWIRQWPVDRDSVLTSTTSAKIGKTAIPYGSVDSLLQAAAGSAQSVKWLLDGPFCAGSLLVQQISDRSGRTFCAHSLFVCSIRMLKQCAARAVLLQHAPLSPNSARRPASACRVVKKRVTAT